MHPFSPPDYSIFYKFNNSIFSLLASQSTFIYTVGRKHSLLQPLLEYLDKAKQNTEDGDSELFYQVQRYLLILQRVGTQYGAVNEFLKKLLEHYYTAANSFFFAIENNTWYEDWFFNNRHQHHKFFDNDIMIQSSEQVTRRNLIENLEKSLSIYITRRDTWHSKRSNELLNLVKHLHGIIVEYFSGVYWVGAIYNDKFNPKTAETIRLTDEEQLCYYLIYQIREFMKSPFSKSRDKELDGEFNRYLYLLRKVQLVDFENSYKMFIMRVLHTQKISRFITSDLFSGCLIEKVNSCSHLNKPIFILERLARLTGIINVTIDIRCPYNVSDLFHNFKSYYAIFTRPSTPMMENINKKLFGPFRPNPSGIDVKVLHVFLIVLFFLEFSKFTRNPKSRISEENIFWAIFYARSNNIKLEDRKNFMNGALNEVIAGFHIYSYLQSQFQEHKSMYRTVIANIGTYDRSISELIARIFPGEISIKVGSIRHEMLLFLNSESEA